MRMAYAGQFILKVDKFSYRFLIVEIGYPS